MKRYNKLLAGASGWPNTAIRTCRKTGPSCANGRPTRTCATAPTCAAFYLSTLDDRVHPGHARKAAAKHEAWGQTFYYHEYREGGHSVGSDHEEDAKRAALLLAYLNREIGDGAD